MELTDSDIVHSQEYSSKTEWKKICLHYGIKIYANKTFCSSCGSKLNSDRIRHGKLVQTTINPDEFSGFDVKNAHLPEDSSKNSWKICLHCGAKVLSTDVFCPNCGKESP